MITTLFKKWKPPLPSNSIMAVTSGKIIPLENVKDEAFAKKMLGEGVAIVPDDDYIVAPCKGEITMLYPTYHAFGILSEEGIEILIHIGINTAALNGIGFKAYVKQGDEVDTGDKIIRFDNYVMKNEGLDMTTMMLFSNNKQFLLDMKKKGYAKKGKTVVVTYDKKDL